MVDAKRGAWIHAEGDFLMVETCCKCNTPFAMSRKIYEAAQLRKEDMAFYCPNGHGQHYRSGESEADKLRRERDRLKQNEAWYEQRLKDERAAREVAERRVAAAKGQITKIKRRASNGVCPCCNRTFANLANHMAGQHPNWVKEPDAADAVVN